MVRLFSDQLELIPMNYYNTLVYRLNGNITNIYIIILNILKVRGSWLAFYMNNETFVHPTNQTLLSSTFLSIILTDYSLGHRLFKLKINQIIDVVINNIDYASHPFHLHGHHVWLLAQGNKSNEGYFNQINIYEHLIYNDKESNLSRYIYS